MEFDDLVDLIESQTLAENLALVSADVSLDAYGVQRLW